MTPTEHELSRHGRVVGESYRDATARLAGQLRAAELDRDRLAAQRDAVLALAAEWEKEANARQPLTLMGHEIHEMNGEQNTCRAHAAELREALGGGS